MWIWPGERGAFWCCIVCHVQFSNFRIFFLVNLIYSVLRESFWYKKPGCFQILQASCRLALSLSFPCPCCVVFRHVQYVLVCEYSNESCFRTIFFSPCRLLQSDWLCVCVVTPFPGTWARDWQSFPFIVDYFHFTKTLKFAFEFDLHTHKFRDQKMSQNRINGDLCVCVGSFWPRMSDLSSNSFSIVRQTSVFAKRFRLQNLDSYLSLACFAVSECTLVCRVCFAEILVHVQRFIQ